MAPDDLRPAGRSPAPTTDVPDPGDDIRHLHSQAMEGYRAATTQVVSTAGTIMAAVGISVGFAINNREPRLLLVVFALLVTMQGLVGRWVWYMCRTLEAAQSAEVAMSLSEVVGVGEALSRGLPTSEIDTDTTADCGRGSSERQKAAHRSRPAQLQQELKGMLDAAAATDGTGRLVRHGAIVGAAVALIAMGVFLFLDWRSSDSSGRSTIAVDTGTETVCGEVLTVVNGQLVMELDPDEGAIVQIVPMAEIDNLAPGGDC